MGKNLVSHLNKFESKPIKGANSKNFGKVLHNAFVLLCLGEQIPDTIYFFALPVVSLTPLKGPAKLIYSQLTEFSYVAFSKFLTDKFFSSNTTNIITHFLKKL